MTTVAIATVGFALQHILMSSVDGAKGAALVDRRASIALGVEAAGLSDGSLALTALAPEQQALKPISRQAAIALNDSIPFSTAPIRAAAPFVLAAATEQDRDRAASCLAQAIYYEAGGDTLDDQRAVAQVVLNRVRHPLFPKTVCGVVFQGSELKTGCQFTFTCDGSMNRVPEPRAFARARALATQALNGTVFGPVGYATHFHAPWVAPYWSPAMEKMVQIGGHLFYRWPGGLGSPHAFTAGYAGGETATPGAGGAPSATEPDFASASPAPPTVPDAPVVEPRRIEAAAVELAPHQVGEREPFVAIPPRIVLAGGPRASGRTYHPPIPRGGSAQPLLSRE